MSITPSLYAKARAEIIALFGWDAGSLSPDQTLRIDCAVALRLALDDLQGRIVRGESADVSRMLTASEALARLLPPAVLATPPSEEHGDPRVEMLRIYMQMRERGEIGLTADRVAELEGEVERLRAQLVDAGIVPALPDVSQMRQATSDLSVRITDDVSQMRRAIDPPLSDIVPPSERAECDAGPQAGLDDPPRRSTRVIEAKANPPAAAPRNWDETDNGRKWQAWVDAGGGGGGFDRWADNR